MGIKISSASMQAARDRLSVTQSYDEMMREADRKEQYGEGRARSPKPTDEELAQAEQRVIQWNALGQRVFKDGKISAFVIVKAEGATKAVFQCTLKISAYSDNLPKSKDGIVYEYWQVWGGKGIGHVCRLVSMPEDFPWMSYNEMHSHLIAALREE